MPSEREEAAHELLGLAAPLGDLSHPTARFAKWEMQRSNGVSRPARCGAGRTSEDAEQLKNVRPFIEATALASIVLPVPGGPKSSTPFQGSRIPTKNSGITSGST